MEPTVTILGSEAAEGRPGEAEVPTGVRSTMATMAGVDGSSQDAATILVVDDEINLRDTLAYSLRREGYTVELASEGQIAVAKARAIRPDIVILDIMLPGMDGLQVCRAIRSESNVPILFLSARGEEIDRVVGLEIGADDYLTKPFAMRELVARVRAMLRRSRMPGVATADGPAEAKDGERGTITIGAIEIDGPRRSVKLSGHPVALKPKEFDLLHYLARHPGLVLSRDALLREVWGYEFPIDTRTVDVHVRWLRQKLEADPGRPTQIETVRGYGYRMAAEPGAS
ncbi:MAG: response regulator [Thermomicrobiales bacterium]